MHKTHSWGWRHENTREDDGTSPRCYNVSFGPRGRPDREENSCNLNSCSSSGTRMLHFKNCSRSHETFQNNPLNMWHANRFIRNLDFIVTMNSSNSGRNTPPVGLQWDIACLLLSLQVNCSVWLKYEREFIFKEVGPVYWGFICVPGGGQKDGYSASSGSER